MDALGRRCLKCQPSSRTGENPPYGMIGGTVETSASFEARYAPLSYPTAGGVGSTGVPTATEKQIPRFVGNVSSWKQEKEALESSSVRPRQALTCQVRVQSRQPEPAHLHSYRHHSTTSDHSSPISGPRGTYWCPCGKARTLPFTAAESTTTPRLPRRRAHLLRHQTRFRCRWL